MNALSCPAPAVAVDEVTHQECVLLNRVLSDKAKLPPVCRPPHVNMQNVAALQKTAKLQQEGGGIGGLVRRLTGAVPGAFNSLSPPHDSKKGDCTLFSLSGPFLLLKRYCRHSWAIWPSRNALILRAVLLH